MLPFHKKPFYQEYDDQKLSITDKKIQLQSLIQHYELKLQCLSDTEKPLQLLMLACWDTPFEKPDIEASSWRKQLFLMKCRRYYAKILNKLEAEAKEYD